jgi:serine-type D-Ala-D-Ala carboxypeptidase/endopeptidase (penicillin-binding protein 4)
MRRGFAEILGLPARFHLGSFPRSPTCRTSQPCRTSPPPGSTLSLSTVRLSLRLAPLLALLAASPAAAEGGLAAALGAAVDASPLANARVGILVEAVDTGEVVYAHDPDALLNPASNVKLVTTAAALARLGPDFRFATELLSDAWPAHGEVRTLWVRGKGDPSVLTERLWSLAGDLAHLGLRKVGELVLDDGYFDAERVGPGYDQEEGDRAYLAPAGALSLDFNAVAVHVAPGERVGGPGRVELEPASAFFALDNRTVTVERDGLGRVLVSTRLEGGKERVLAEGRIALGSRPHAVWRRIDDPALFFGHTFRALLEERGVKVGRVRLGRAPDGAQLLAVSQSDPLAEIVRRLNKTSNNFTAEQLLKTLGAEVKGAPGTWPNGVLAAEEFLAEVGIPRGSYVLRNGSGLNDANRMSARQLVTLLRAMWTRFPLQPEYLVSLPVAGRDGTIRWRMDGTQAAGRLRAKTGTLDGVVSLSGYVQEASGRVLVFAVLVNDSPGRAGVVRAVDALGAALAAGGAPEEEALAANAAPATRDPAERLRTFYALGKSGDVRNEPLLRRTLFAEADPLFRLALSECVYLANPDSDSARHGLLEALAADPSALPRLWDLVPGEAPVVSSLAAVAAEGEHDALRRLLDLAGASLSAGPLAQAVEDALAGVAAAAPEELLSALSAAPSADAAVARLVAGLARAEDRGRAFQVTLHALSARGDEQAELARRVSAQLGPGRR